MTSWALAFLLLSFSSPGHGFSLVYQQPGAPQGRKLFGGYRIVPKPCHSRSGQHGVCMFNYECLQREGEVISACMDGFLFGTCCSLPAGTHFHVADPELEAPGMPRPPAPSDNELQLTDRSTTPPRPLPQADTVLLHHNGTLVTDDNDPEDVFGPPAAPVTGSHGEGETILVHPGTGSAGSPSWQDDTRLEAVPLVANPVSTSTTDGKHTTFYALDTSKNPFPLGTTVKRPAISDATDMNEIDGNLASTEDVSSEGPIYYSSRWPASRPTPGKKPSFVSKYTERPYLTSSSTSYFSDSDDSMVPLPVITLDDDQKRRPPLQEPEPLPEPEPYPESHSESINHILSILNDSNLGVIGPEVQSIVSTPRPHVQPGISTWGLVDGRPSLSWRPPDTSWMSSTPSLSTSSYLASHSNNATILFSTQHLHGPSTTSTSYVSGPFLPITSVDYTMKPNITKKPAYSKPAPTVIVLQNIASEYTTHWPSSIHSSSGDNYQSMVVTTKPSTPSQLDANGDQHTKKPTVHISSTINMYQGYETTKRPTSSFTVTKKPSMNIPMDSDKYDNVAPNERPTDNLQSTYETSTITRRPTVHISTGVENYQSSTFSYRPTVFVSTTAGYPQTSAFITKKPLGPSAPSYTASHKPDVSTTGGTSNTTPFITKRPVSSTSSSSTPPFSSTHITMASTRPSSVSYMTTRPDLISNRPTTIGQQSKPSGGKLPQELPTTINYNSEDIVYSTSIADLVNFPPVRNPQLNMSIVNQQENPWVVQSTDDTPGLPDIVLDNDVSTPPFMEDDKLNIKLHSFVSKIVNSLQQNFLELEDVVLKTGSNFSSTIGPPLNSRPGTTTRKPTRVTTSRRPSTGVPVSTTRKPVRLSTSPRPATSSQQPITSSRKPATGQRPRPTPNQATSVRPTVRPRPTLSTTTRRPRPSRRPTIVPSLSSTTTRRPRPRPTTRRTTTTSTTAAAEQQASTRPTPTRRPTTKRPTTVRTTTTTTTTTTTPTTTTEETTLVTEVATAPSSVLSTTAKPVDYRRECGVRPLMKKGGRIVGGKGATFGAWPWQVLVKESTWLGLFTKNKCGGVLITARFVITAAHCQPGFLANLVAVLGEFDLSGELESKRSVTKNVRRVIVHRHYDPATFANDLALLELDTPVSFDTHIVPVCMPRDGEDFTGRVATVTGWGRLKYGGGVPSVLQEVQVPIIENSVCQEMFQTAGHSKVILSSFMCAGYANGQRDSCEGDSGGPLMMEREDGRWMLVGTVSHGIKCAAPYLPGVYMRTTYYKPWLRSITGVQ